MGTNSSRRMEEGDSRSVSEDSLGSVQEDSELTAILQYLIRSGQVGLHLVPPEPSDSDDECCPPVTPPKIDYKPDTKIIDKSEISWTTKQACGLTHSTSKKRPTNLVSMLGARQNGMYGNGSFTNGDRCQIYNSHLPYKIHKVAMYYSKAFCGTYSTDGNQFLTACQDRLIRLYDTRFMVYKQFRIIQARDVGWSILDTAFSPDGQYVTYSSWSESLHLVRLDDPDCHLALPLCPEDRRFCIFSVVFSSDGEEILGGANDGNLYVYNRNRNQRTLRIEGHEYDVNTVAFADNTSQILYSGGDDGLCKVWDRRTLSEAAPKPVGVLAGHKDGITFIDSRGDGRYLISNSKDQSIKLWDIRHFSTQDAQESTKKAVSQQNWDYRWQGVPKRLKNAKTNLKGDSSVMTYRRHSVLQTLIRCRFSPAFTTGQRYIYTGCASGRIIIYDVLTGDIVKTLKAHTACVRDVAWHPYRSEIVSTSWDYSVMCWSHFGLSLDDYSRVLEEFGGDFESFGDGDRDTAMKIAERSRVLRRSERLAEQRRRAEAEQQKTRNGDS